MARYDYNVKRINYVRKPFAKKSITCILTALVAAGLCGMSLYLSVSRAGDGQINVAGWAVSSFLFAVTSLVYGAMSLTEEEKNYILARIGMVVSGLLALFWVCMVIVGVVTGK
jgi:hypothetical protein